jgi:KDO2-lipid IV(A) lauroyltransferase
MNEWLEYLPFRLLAWLAGGLTFRGAGRVGRFLGNVAFRCTSFRQQVTRENLTKAFPLLPAEEITRIAAGAYRNYATTLLEMLWAGTASEEELRAVLRLANPSVPRDALARGKGLILLSGHFGSWELIVNALALHLGSPVHVIVQRQRNTRINGLIDRRRRRFGSTTVEMGNAVREAVKALRNGKIVALLGDQSGSKEAAFVDFFGRPAATHRGAAAFSLKTGAPIVMFFFIRQANGTYETAFEEVNREGLDAGGEKEIEELTRRHTAILEKYIRRYPDHWLWMHKRWKHNPPASMVEHA